MNKEWLTPARDNIRANYSQKFSEHRITFYFS